MNPDKQRIAIAEACGFRNIHESDGIWFGTAQGSKLEATWPLPDYLHELNAMHEAETVLLKRETGWSYVKNLMKVRKLEWCEEYIDILQLVHTTAAQRAEAFLRTIGRWQDDSFPVVPATGNPITPQEMEDNE